MPSTRHSPAAELNCTLAKARSEAKLSAIVGQDAFEVAASTFAALANARASIVETHRRLSETQIQVGLRTVSFGDNTKPPPPSAETRHLRIVA